MDFKQIALIAPTASGKTALSIQLAHKYNAIILSLDSLAVYKDIDIASAKPTVEQMGGIKHFGIDIVKPDEQFDVILFIDEYKKAKKYAIYNKKNLIIVGGTSFYLKAMIDGISKVPKITQRIQHKIKSILYDLESAYKILQDVDPIYGSKIKPNDRYRIQKGLEIFYATDISPTQYFKDNKPEPIIKNIKIYQIKTNPDILRQRIDLRTKNMLDDGLIDEVLELEKKYTRYPNSMQSIGIKETLDYIDSKITKPQLKDLVSVHTAQLAKRQRTFNRSQFQGVIEANLEELSNIIKF
jgi:tRNA dimethylallyltransferase